MIKYFEFEKEIEAIDKLIHKTERDDKVNISKIESLNMKRSKF